MPKGDITNLTYCMRKLRLGEVTLLFESKLTKKLQARSTLRFLWHQSQVFPTVHCTFYCISCFLIHFDDMILKLSIRLFHSQVLLFVEIFHTLTV